MRPWVPVLCKRSSNMLLATETQSMVLQRHMEFHTQPCVTMYSWEKKTGWAHSGYVEYVETKDVYIKPGHWVHMWRPLICDLFHHILSNSIAKPLLKLWYGWAITSHITCGCNYLTMPSMLDNENMTAKEGFDIVLRCLLKKLYNKA